MEIVTLAEARRTALKHYFTGVPCPQGHISKRIVSSRACFDCMLGRAPSHEKNRAAVKKWFGKLTFKNRLLRAAKTRHVKYGYPGVFCLTPEDLTWPSHCPILGIELVYGAQGPVCEAAASIDRVDSRFGYVKGNVQVISMRANRIKSDATPEEMMKLAVYMAKIDVATLS